MVLLFVCFQKKKKEREILTSNRGSQNGPDLGLCHLWFQQSFFSSSSDCVDMKGTTFILSAKSGGSKESSGTTGLEPQRCQSEDGCCFIRLCFVFMTFSNESKSNKSLVLELSSWTKIYRRRKVLAIMAVSQSRPASLPLFLLLSPSSPPSVSLTPKDKETHCTMGHHLSPQEQLLETFHCQKISGQFFPPISLALSLSPSLSCTSCFLLLSSLPCPPAILFFSLSLSLHAPPPHSLSLHGSQWSGLQVRLPLARAHHYRLQRSGGGIISHQKALTDVSATASHNGFLFLPQKTMENCEWYCIFSP